MITIWVFERWFHALTTSTLPFAHYVALWLATFIRYRLINHFDGNQSLKWIQFRASNAISGSHKNSVGTEQINVTSIKYNNNGMLECDRFNSRIRMNYSKRKVLFVVWRKIDLSSLWLMIQWSSGVGEKISLKNNSIDIDPIFLWNFSVRNQLNAWRFHFP